MEEAVSKATWKHVVHESVDVLYEDLKECSWAGETRGI